MSWNRRFVIRTIKRGMVRINNTLFVPDGRYMEYDGRLEGQRYAFGLYYRADWNGISFWDDTKVILWGSEQEFKSLCKLDYRNSDYIIDGTFPWMWWFRTGKILK